MATPLACCLRHVQTAARPAQRWEQVHSTRLLLPCGISRLTTAGSELGTSRRAFATGIALTLLPTLSACCVSPPFLLRGDRA
jgi:hypothetical protein